MAARYTLTAKSAASNVRAALVDTVEAGTIGLRQQGDAPELRVVLHVRSAKIPIVDPKEPDPQRFDVAYGGKPDAAGKFYGAALGGVRDGNPAATLRQHFNLNFSFPGRVALQPD